MFCEQKPGVDLDPLEMSFVAQSASLSIADQQLMLSLPTLFDMSAEERPVIYRVQKVAQKGLV